MSKSDQKIQNLLEWLQCKDNDSKLSIDFYLNPKLSIKYSETSGFGIYTNSSITLNERLIEIPHRFLLSYTSVKSHILNWNNTKEELPNQVYSNLSESDLFKLSSFQLISLYLVVESLREDKSFWYPFIQCLPSLESFKGIPLVWEVLRLKIDNPNLENIALENLSKDKSILTSTYTGCLPLFVRNHVKNQYEKLIEDYQVISNLLNPDISSIITLEKFLWAWICINSRCLYMNISPKVMKSHSVADNFTLCPLVDFMNHCDDETNSAKIQITNTKFFVFGFPLDLNEEVFFSYGSHDNGFLMTEYGFVLPLEKNKWEFIDISEYIIKRLSIDQINFLKDSDYYGEYTVNLEDVSFRTTVVLSLLGGNSNKRVKLLINGIIYEEEFLIENNKILVEILREYSIDCLKIVDNIDINSYPDLILLNFFKNQNQICEFYIGNLQNL